MRLVACGCAVLAVVAASGCRSHRKEEAAAVAPTRLNVVLVTIDTLRADRLGCYGYARAATPNLDALARRGALFENAVTPTPLTAPSHASIFTGVYPTVHKVRDTGGFVLQTPNPTLAEVLQKQGWATAAFVGASVLKKGFGFERGFAVYDDQLPKPEAGKAAGDFADRRAGEVVDHALEWLGKQSGSSYFLWVHVFDPHSPYDPPPPFRERYRDRLYDGEVAYTDQQLGRLFDAVNRKPGAGGTLVMVLSDHGEALGDHGEYNHGVFLYDETVRIACIMAGPGVPQGTRIRQQARGIDVLPTILALMGRKPPEGVQGASLAPALHSREDPGAWSYEETLYTKINMGWAELRGIRTNQWKYVRAPRPELYDLSRDPGEAANVAESHAAEVRDFEAKLASVAAAGSGEKVQTTMVDRKTLAQLKSLGYLGGSSASEYTLTGKGTDPKDRKAVLKLLFEATSPDAGTPVAKRLPALRQALAADPANPSVYYQLGLALSGTGQGPEALELYRQALRNGVRNFWIFARLGSLYRQQGNRDEALANWERATRMNPSDCESLSDLGMLYTESGRLGDAERVYKWCLATGDEYALAYNGLGLVAVNKHDMESARGYFEKAVALDPELLEAQLNLGRIYKLMGANTRARACFEAFLAKASPAEYGQLIARIKAELAEMR